jgi:uncharacterized protein YbaR (Trm112 family)
MSVRCPQCDQPIHIECPDCHGFLRMYRYRDFTLVCPHCKYERELGRCPDCDSPLEYHYKSVLGRTMEHLMITDLLLWRKVVAIFVLFFVSLIVSMSILDALSS